MNVLTYLASPYSHADPLVIEQRYQAVCQAAAKLMEHGPVFSPVAHSHHIADHMRPCLRLDHDFWLTQDFAVLERCSRMVVLMLPGWTESYGVREETRFARIHHIPVEYMPP